MNRRRRLALIAALSLAPVAAPRAAPDEELLGKSRGLLLFGERESAQGERFHDASIETSALAAVLAAKNARVGAESMAAERIALWRGVLASLTPAGNGREP